MHSFLGDAASAQKRARQQAIAAPPGAQTQEQDDLFLTSVSVSFGNLRQSCSGPTVTLYGSVTVSSRPGLIMAARPRLLSPIHVLPSSPIICLR